MDQVGAVLAPMAVLLLVACSVGLRTIVALSLLPGLVAITLLLVFVREHGRSSTPDQAPVPPGERVPIGRPMRRLLTAVAVFGCGDFAKTLLVLWALGPAGGLLTPTALGTGVVLYALFNIVTVGSAYMAGRLSDNVGRKPVLGASYLIGAAGAAVPVLLPAGLGAGALALALSGVMVGAEESVERAWAADLAGRLPGRAFGLLHSINGLADLAASAGVGLVWTLAGPEAAFGAAALLMAAGACLSMTVPASSGRTEAD